VWPTNFHVIAIIIKFYKFILAIINYSKFKVQKQFVSACNRLTPLTTVGSAFCSRFCSYSARRPKIRVVFDCDEYIDILLAWEGSRSSILP